MADAAAALVGPEAVRLVIARDLDDLTPDQVVSSLVQSLCRSLGSSASQPGVTTSKVFIGEAQIAIVPVGILGDAELDTLGITRHAAEDYLLKILLADANLSGTVADFKSLLIDVLSTIRNAGLSFTSIKEVWQLSRSLILRRFNDRGDIEATFARADSDTLDQVLAPLISQLQQALAS